MDVGGEHDGTEHRTGPLHGKPPRRRGARHRPPVAIVGRHAAPSPDTPSARVLRSSVAPEDDRHDVRHLSTASPRTAFSQLRSSATPKGNHHDRESVSVSSELRSSVTRKATDTHARQVEGVGVWEVAILGRPGGATVPDRRWADGAHGAAAAVAGGVDVLVKKSAAHRVRVVGGRALEEDGSALAWQKV